MAAARPIPQTEPPLQRTLALRTEIADHLRHARGVRCEAEDIVVTAGTSEALALVGLALREYLASGSGKDSALASGAVRRHIATTRCDYAHVLGYAGGRFAVMPRRVEGVQNLLVDIMCIIGHMHDSGRAG
jgi:hypothetical protein